MVFLKYKTEDLLKVRDEVFFFKKLLSKGKYGLTQIYTQNTSALNYYLLSNSILHDSVWTYD